MQEIRERRLYASNEWDPILAEAKRDRLCVAGKPWEALDPDGLAQRKSVNRPHLALDELGQYINQTVNDVRANPRGIKFAPKGNGASDAGAELYENHVREIEYRSRAQVAYAMAFDYAVTNGYGWLRITTKREHIRTFNQDLWIEPIVNPDQVLPDPNATWPDSSDMQYLFYIEPWQVSEFTRRWPKAKVRDFSAEHRSIASQWIQSDVVHVAEYWSLKTVARRLVAFQLPTGEIQTALVDELPDGQLPAGVENLREEDVDDTTVESRLTNGLEILDENEWKGKYIPFVSCFGKVIYVDEGSGAKRQLFGMTRLAREPYMLYCYIRTCEAEAIGAVPRSAWIGYKGQFSNPLTWQKANHEPVEFLEAEIVVEGMPPGAILPLPQRQPWDPPLNNLELSAEAARRAIQAAMGISPLPTPAQRDNQKSGKALERIESSGQKGSFHFVDHYTLMIERTGVILEDLFDKYLDAAREITVREQDDSAMIQRINDPSDPESVSTKGDYRVTVSTGPADSSQREAADNMVDALVSNISMIAQISGPPKAAMILGKSIKLKQLGPIGDEIVEILSPTQKGPDGKPIPPEMQALIQENQQLKGALQQAAQEKQGKVVEQQGKFAIAQMQEDAETQRAAADREVKIAVAELSAKVDRLGLFLEESRMIGVRQHDSMEAARQRSHDALERTKDRIHEQAQSALGHEQALEAGAQAAALAPAPETGATA